MTVMRQLKFLTQMIILLLNCIKIKINKNKLTIKQSKIKIKIIDYVL